MRKIIISAIIVFLNTINLRFQIYCIILVHPFARTSIIYDSCSPAVSGSRHLLLCNCVATPLRHASGSLNGASVSAICTRTYNSSVTLCRSLVTLLFTCMCGLMMNDVLRIDTASGAPVITPEDEVKNDAFGIITLILNLLALLFIIYTVAPEYRFVKRLIATIRMVRFELTPNRVRVLAND